MVGLVDSKGTVVNSYKYDAFGNIVEAKEQVHNRFKYAGEQYDQVTGQYYLRARFYNPVVGRFTQEDTYRGDGLNLYSYVKNNPIKYCDPSGYCAKSKNNIYENNNTVNFDRGVTFFGEDALRFVNKDDAVLGPPEGLVWLISIDDAARIRNVADAARETGMARSVADAYVSGKDVYGISFPTKDLEIRVPTPEDAGGWPHYLEGGHTAVRGGSGDTGFYMINETKEFVTPGGRPMPKGSVLFKLENNGSWTKVREW